MKGSQKSVLVKTLDWVTLTADVSFYNADLNDQQKTAVMFSMLQKEVAIIHGPPGTGKTTTVVEYILQAISQNLKVLACAPSNVAVDNLMQHLTDYELKMIRVGHSSRVSSSLHLFSLDAHVSTDKYRDILLKKVDEVMIKNQKKGSSQSFLSPECDGVGIPNGPSGSRENLQNGKCQVK
ncbi:DNA-binding protein SMUBP-2 [Nephila pilipes]|uniref:DNA-binding protein SMUBP-2 n=1 Tax=Nephila pilipes TaxID=299642 RepID=A0A8X6M7F1_NEPPI|nr:DNA-binding protein SMUBP-2 [Nephila pilipes]